MPANTSPDNITYPVTGDQVSPLVTPFANLATSVQNAFNSLRTTVNNNKLADSGTYAQRTALTGLRAGHRFWQTNAGGDGIGEYRWNGTAWLYYGATPGGGTKRGTAAQRAATTSNYWDFWVDTDGTQRMYVGNESGGWRQFSGEQPIAASGAWDGTVTSSPAMAWRTLNVVLPTVISANESIQVTTSSGGSYIGIVALAGVTTRGASSTTVTVRHLQFLNATVSSASFLWQVIRL